MYVYRKFCAKQQLNPTFKMLLSGQVLKSLKEEVVDLAQNVLAREAPSAAFKLVEIMESKRPIVQANNKLSAAQTLLDRVGVSKIDKYSLYEKIFQIHNIQDV